MPTNHETHRDLKPEQAVAARTLDRHVSVTAGPGSGKTTVLVERFLHILRQNQNLNIDQIVAITFTKRAANEMRERLRKDLDRILSQCDPDERERWMRYKRTLDSAVINTFHNFCARMLREFPVEARIDPQFLTLDQHDASIVLEASVEETLTEFISKERELTSQLAVGFGRSKLAEALATMYKNLRGQGLKLDEVEKRTLASHSTPEAHQDALAELDRLMNMYIDFGRLTVAAEARRALARRSWPALRELIQKERPSLADYCAAIESFRATVRAAKNTSAGRLMEQLDTQLWGESKQGPFGLVPQICFDLHAKDYAQEVVQILKSVEQRYREKKQNLAALDFDDLQLRALELLDQPAVLARATQRYRFFLVDEFQDTNSIQRDLMYKLALSPAATKANLFIVGDRKQSIYGFRGADVDVFQQTTQALKEAGGIEQPLHLNFRSQPPLINFFNHLFARLFEQDEKVAGKNLDELGFVDFEPSRAERAQVYQSPLVELLIDTKGLAEDDSRARRDAADRDANQVAQRILSLIRGTGDGQERDHGRKDAPKGDAATGPVQYRDIALLFRAMTDVQSYETVFRRLHIPFQTVQGKGFYEREEISDLIQLLRFLDNKTDEIALASVLRSPLGGVSDNALLALRCAPWLNEVDSEKGARHFNQPRRLYYALRRHKEIAHIDEHDHAQLDRVGSLLRKLIDRRNHSPLADLLRFAVDESEYLTVIAANFDGGQKLANVHKLFDLAERFERSGAYLIRDLVRYVEEFEAIGSREGEGQIDESANAVRLMTIHQAKGLEFPVVIIPNLHHRSINPQEHWFALDRHNGLTVKIPDGRGKQVAGCTMEKFRERGKLREQFESVRLLYVAATRAQDRLILAGVTDALDKLSGASDTWLKLIWQKLELQVSRTDVVDFDEKTQLAVTLNLADETRGQSLSAEAVSKQEIDSASSLSVAFPLLQPINPEPSSGHQFSVTQLINYRRCPRQYYFDRVLHIPSADELAVWNNAEASEPPANLTATLKGAVIHRFCETYLSGEDAEARLSQSLADVVQTRQSQFADRLLDIKPDEAVKELWPLAQNYLSSNLFQRIETRGKSIAASNRTPGNGAGLWSELSFRLRLPLGILTGTIDKLLITEAGPDRFDVEVVDFKTNRFAGQKPSERALSSSKGIAEERQWNGPAGALSRPRRATSNAQMGFDFSTPAVESAIEAEPEISIENQIRQTASDYQLQMQAYALAVSELLPGLGSTRVSATLHFLHPNVEFRLGEDLLARDVCAKALDDAMREIITSREPEEFPVRPAVHCRMCNFLKVCAAGGRWVADSTSPKVQTVGSHR